MANVRDCGLEVNEFELQSGYYVHFRTETCWKDMKSLIFSAIDQIVSYVFFYKDDVGIK